MNAATSTTTTGNDSRRDWLALLLLVALVFGVYGTCLTGVVAHGDDDWLLWDLRHEPRQVTDAWAKEGRWANGLLFRLAWSGADEIGDLWRPRLVSIVGIALLSCGMYASLRRVVFVMPDSRLPLGPRFIYDEFGYLATSSHWTCRGAVGLAALDVAPEKLAAYEHAEFVLIICFEAPPAAAPGTWLIYARTINNLGRWRTSGYPLPDPPRRTAP